MMPGQSVTAFGFRLRNGGRASAATSAASSWIPSPAFTAASIRGASTSPIAASSRRFAPLRRYTLGTRNAPDSAISRGAA